MIVSCGEALVDVLPDGRAVPGGGPMNVAVAAARLGVESAFVGRISSDEHGARIRAHLEASGVLLGACQQGDEPTARAVVEMAPGPVFRFEGEGTADASMTSVDLSALGPGPKIVHGGTLGIFRGSTATVLAELIAGHDGLVTFDPNVRPQIIELFGREVWNGFAQRWIDRADLVKASDEDLDWMGVSPEQLIERGAAIVLRTLGADGAEIHLADGTRRQVEAPAVEVIDSVGAGDSFIGAVLCQLVERHVTDRAALVALDGDAWVDIVGFAVKVAAVTVARPGADPPRRSELAPT